LLVGNDVVDLHDPESRPEALHSRFDARVFTSEERESLTVSASPHVLRWTLWAAKESAYKVAKKIDPGARFLWRKFSTHPRGAGRFVVTCGSQAFDVRVDRTDEWVHAVATIADPPSTHRRVKAGIERLAEPDPDSSRIVRNFVRVALGSLIELPPSQIQVATERGIPVALWRNRRLPVDLSLSHHGRLVAWACGDCAVPDDQRGFVAA
jgi:phosphopantetheinyl transferase (holo-ACP synthase)